MVYWLKQIWNYEITHYLTKIEGRRYGRGGRMIYAMNFFRKYQIRPTETMAFTSPDINKAGILILNINEVRSVKIS
jgi:hypothetical protein